MMRPRLFALLAATTLLVGTSACSSSSSPGATDGGGDATPLDSTPADSGEADSTPTDSGADSSTDAVDDVADSGADASDGGLAAACTASGGTVQSQPCCASTGDFPNLCSVGACGCSPSSSHTIQACVCSGGRCWNGSTCVLGP